MANKNLFMVANFKMNKTNTELTEYFSAFPKIPTDYKHTIVFCPAATGLPLVAKHTGRFHLGAQNLGYAESGAFTGEISAKMITDLGAKYVLIGHSERRAIFGENDSTVNQKVKTALQNGLTVILCVGETEAERTAGQTNNVLSRQIKAGMDGITNSDKIIIAYEPVWAIGTGKTATNDDIATTIGDIKKIVKNIPILYGGSVNEKNAADIMDISDVAGVLVGGACLVPEKFAQICKL